MPPDLDRAMAAFERARAYAATSAQLAAEIAWQRAASPDRFTETDLLREAAWVILCSGFREAVVRRAFGYISLCFCDWESASAIVEAASACMLAARSAFNNPQKLAAIVQVARCVNTETFAALKRRILEQPVAELRRFPFIGDVTVWHLAKNLGCDVAKPDRHLVRLAHSFGYPDPHQLCAALACKSGEPVRVVDLVLWRYAADRPSVAAQAGQ